MNVKKSQEVFFELLNVGLWGANDNHNQNENLYEGFDWSDVYRLAEEQSVIGLIADGIDRFKIQVSGFSIPQEWVLQFVGSALQLEQRNKAMNEYLAQLKEKLRRNEVYTLLVKGQGIAQCYERPLWRACGDIDLLLSTDNYEKAKAVLLPLASQVEPEYEGFKHLGMTIDGVVVELHGTMHSRLSKRIDRGIDDVQDECFMQGEVRSWMNGNTQIFLPAANQDVIFVFKHILHHFFIEGVGVRQVCDWCRLLFCYRDKLDLRALESRIKRMGIMSEWKTFAALAVNTLGMPRDTMPLYDSDPKWGKKADKVLCFIMETGNFGHNRRDASTGKKSFLGRKASSLWLHTKDNIRQIAIFPLDSIRVWWGMVTTGLYETVRGYLTPLIRN